MKNLALIGTGRWGQNYISESEKLDCCHIKYIRGSNYHDLKGMYGDIDGVIIASPATTHLEVINYFEMMPLLVEKPFVMNEDSLSMLNTNNVMAAHTYIYHPKIRMLKGKDIRYLTFKMYNTERYNSDTSILWELAPHGVSICYYLFGMPDSITARIDETTLHVGFFYDHTACNMQFNWNSNNKHRSLSVNSNNIILDTDSSPMQNEIQAFCNFIDTGKTDTGLEHARAVTILLSAIESIL
jgi:predicted dehydrogenase